MEKYNGCTDDFGDNKGCVFDVLAIDDDPVQLSLIETAARELPFPKIQMRCAPSCSEAKAAIEDHTPDVVICDNILPDGRGRDVLFHTHGIDATVPVIIMTAHESIEGAVDLIKSGARDYIVKPVSGNTIQRIIATALEWRSGAQARNDLQEAALTVGIHQSSSAVMQEMVGVAIRAAQSTVSILVQGESGTGKELIARLVHRESRLNAPFVPVHIAALPETLVESALFGHVRGAFTGAHEDHLGYFEQADGGTLFIDEVGEIPLSIQVKLLRAIQFKEIQRVGDTTSFPVDVRIVAATNRDLTHMINEGTFREDLYYRINVIKIDLPPLRKRKEDLPTMIDNKIEMLARRNDRAVSGIAPTALASLMEYPFPGNVRELENILERAVILATGSLVQERDLPDFVRTNKKEVFEDTSLDAQLRAVERTIILRALKAAKGNQSKAARTLQITERRLRSRIAILGIVNQRNSP